MSGATPSLRPKRKAAFDNEDEDSDDDHVKEVKRRRKSNEDVDTSDDGSEKEVKRRKLLNKDEDSDNDTKRDVTRRKLVDEKDEDKNEKEGKLRKIIDEDSPVKKKDEIIAENNSDKENEESDDSDEDGTKISDDMADACKTACKICHQVFTLTNMRNHTSKEHNIQITKYKSIYGNFHEDFSLILEVYYHKCKLCGKLVLLDSDRLGGHIKGVHKMTERDYKAQYMKGAPLGPKSTSTPGATDRPTKMLTSRRNAYDVDKDHFKFIESEDSLEFLLSEMEYDCNISDCTTCCL